MSTEFQQRNSAAVWPRKWDDRSLVEVFRSIPVAHAGSRWRKVLAFTGPGYLVAVGYMDPGNWATALSSGARFGYTLLAVVLISSLMAIVLQSLCARLAIATGRDLAQACRDSYSPMTARLLWITAEIAICATDLAEVLGTALALNLLFGLPLEIGVVITALDVFVVLWLQHMGFRWIEAFIVTLLGVIAISLGIQIAMASPDWGQVLGGFVPQREIISQPEMLYLAIGIIGATVMPHNLYLHSAIVQTRAFGSDLPARREALRFATLDSTMALGFALLVNASLLILAAAAFYGHGGSTPIEDLEQAHAMLATLLQSPAAPALFAIALLCCGMNSSVTATMAGQVVMEGFVRLRLPSWLRRLTTRSVAIVPAVVIILLYGPNQTGKLLVLSQVILSLQLPFAVIPLILISGSRQKMREMVAPRWLFLLSLAMAATIIVLNLLLLVQLVVRPHA
ncbi:MAG TPA: Nramp family divalent metal transporter [Bosea sp. (in: a-proteobacteria)]|jgi:manganese transport protein|uniref:Nramp family divalent metal transporter n=1 Tax=Bosea sp. (in: a-proteobacteria) TaxID=1871050 RepID=UPI002E0D1616|nr:Nramp family divalent metal transporter [Bosea sp. (in: a-proteobacteria)]